MTDEQLEAALKSALSAIEDTIHSIDNAEEVDEWLAGSLKLLHHEAESLRIVLTRVRAHDGEGGR